MNNEQPVTLHMAPSINSKQLVIVLGLVAMISGLLIVTAYQATLPSRIVAMSFCEPRS